MNILPYVAVSLILVVSSASEEQEIKTFPPVKEAKQASSEPEGLKALSKETLNECLQNWSQVPKKEFYYESTDGVVFPMQEGILTLRGGAIAKWRFYHCGGLRIDCADGKSIFFLPGD